MTPKSKNGGPHENTHGSAANQRQQQQLQTQKRTSPPACAGAAAETFASSSLSLSAAFWNCSSALSTSLLTLSTFFSASLMFWSHVLCFSWFWSVTAFCHWLRAKISTSVALSSSFSARSHPFKARTTLCWYMSCQVQQNKILMHRRSELDAQTRTLPASLGLLCGFVEGFVLQKPQPRHER